MCVTLRELRTGGMGRAEVSIMDKVGKMMERGEGEGKGGMKNNNGKRGAIWEGKKGD
jgi:hypothetical protein